jgi:subfamily B ATP-binding cassette protein MsbA
MASDMTSRELYARLLTYVRPYWKVFAIALLAMALSSLAEPVFPAMMKFLLDDGFSKSSGWDWLLYPMAVMGIFLARAIFGFVGDYAMSWVSNNVIAELREAMFARMVRLPTRYYSDNLSGRMMSRIAYDVTGVAGAATNALSSLVKDTLSIVGLMAWLLYLNWKLTLITLSVVPFIAFVVRFFSKRLRSVAKGSRSRWARLLRYCRKPLKATR